MTAWQVYWVMQLDSIGFGLGVLGCVLIGIGLLLALVADEGLIEWHPVKTVLGFFAAGLLLWLVNMFLPSTKTAAAMVVLPAITSESATAAVAPEVRELYDLAKDALNHAAGKDAKQKD
jgi:hypothetical protein